MAGGDEPLLAIIVAIIGHHRVPAREHLRRVREVEAALQERSLALGGVEGDLHQISVGTDIATRNIRRDENRGGATHGG